MQDTLEYTQAHFVVLQAHVPSGVTLVVARAVTCIEAHCQATHPQSN